jgi:hypothetical protein
MAVVVGPDAGELEPPEPGLLRRAAEADTQHAVTPNRHRDREVAKRHGTELQRDFCLHSGGDQRRGCSETKTRRRQQLIEQLQ